MKNDQPDMFLDCFKKIISGKELDIISNAWKTLEELESNEVLGKNPSYYCNRNYDKLLRYILIKEEIINIGEIPRVLEWFSKYPLTTSASKPVSDDIAEFLFRSAPRFMKEQCLAEILKVMQDNREIYIPHHNNHVKLCKAIVEALSWTKLLDKSNRKKYAADLKCVQKFIKMINDNQIYENNENISLECFISMCELFLKSDIREDPSPALIIFLQIVKEDLWKQHMAIAVGRIIAEFKDEEKIIRMLTVFCKWFSDHSVLVDHAEYLSVWLCLFIRGLEENKSKRIADRVAERTLPIIFKRCLELERFYTIPPEKNIILNLMMKVYTLDFHHKLMIMIREVLQNNFEKTKFMPLFQCTVALFKRFEEHLEKHCPICDGLKKQISCLDNNMKENTKPIPVPYIAEEPEEMDTSYPSTSSGLSRSNHGKVGLCNLGNTCYMNSVLQALFMTRNFCREVLLYKGSNDLEDQIVLKNLQNLFAMLKFSKKSSLAPHEILQASRPAYFMIGHQQDSSEFLCHLLDVMYEQEKAVLSRSIVSNQNSSVKVKIEDKEMTEIDETPGGSNSPMNEDGTVQMSRWTTEENLSEGASLQRKTQSLADFTQGEELTQTQNGLSDSHSDSTDSGIQSVGGEDSTSSSSSSAVPSLSCSSSSYLVHKVFGGELQITYLCDKCQTESVNKDKFRDLQLCFLDDLESDKAITVQDLISCNYLSPEKLTGDNKYRCDKCAGLCDALRIIKISQAPEHLILTLKHFRYDSESRLRAKLRRKVIYDETVQLPVIDRDHETYQLYAAVVHSGYNMDYGHYITYACDSRNYWYKFNDSFVTSTTLEDFKRLEPPDTPYILFYKRKSNYPDEEDVQLTDLHEDLQEYVQKCIYEDQRRIRLSMARQSSYNTRRSWDRDKNDDDDEDGGGGRLGPPSSCRDAINIPNQTYLF